MLIGIVLAVIGTVPADASVPLSRLVVRQSDLVPGYRVFAASGVSSPEQMQQYTNGWLSTHALRAHGFVGQYVEELIGNGRDVRSYVVSFRDRTGARWLYQKDFSSLRPPSSVNAPLGVPAIGDAQYATHGCGGSCGYTLLFLRGRYEAYIEIQTGHSAVDMRTQLVALGRLMSGRLSRAG
jgi:hypothetical protein